MSAVQRPESRKFQPLTPEQPFNQSRTAVTNGGKIALAEAIGSRQNSRYYLPFFAGDGHGLHIMRVRVRLPTARSRWRWLAFWPREIEGSGELSASAAAVAPAACGHLVHFRPTGYPAVFGLKIHVSTVRFCPCPPQKPNNQGFFHRRALRKSAKAPDCNRARGGIPAHKPPPERGVGAGHWCVGSRSLFAQDWARLQLFQQRLGRLRVGGAEAFGQPAVRSPRASRAPRRGGRCGREPREADRCA